MFCPPSDATRNERLRRFYLDTPADYAPLRALVEEFLSWPESERLTFGTSHYALFVTTTPFEQGPLSWSHSTASADYEPNSGKLCIAIYHLDEDVDGYVNRFKSLRPLILERWYDYPSAIATFRWLCEKLAPATT